MVHIVQGLKMSQILISSPKKTASPGLLQTAVISKFYTLKFLSIPVDSWEFSWIPAGINGRIKSIAHDNDFIHPDAKVYFHHLCH